MDQFFDLKTWNIETIILISLLVYIVGSTIYRKAKGKIRVKKFTLPGGLGAELEDVTLTAIDIGAIRVSDLELIVNIVIDSVIAANSLCGIKLERKMSFVQEKITVLQGLKEQRFFKMLKDAGVADNCLNSHPDVQFYKQALRNVFYYDNGTQSLVSQFRRNLRSENYRASSNDSEKENKDRFDEFVTSFSESAMQRMKKYMSDNYRTDIYDECGNHTNRTVTNEHLYDSDSESAHVQEVIAIFREIFEYASSIDATIVKEHQNIERKRKEQIHQIITIRRGGVIQNE